MPADKQVFLSGIIGSNIVTLTTIKNRIKITMVKDKINVILLGLKNLT